MRFYVGDDTPCTGRRFAPLAERAEQALRSGLLWRAFSGYFWRNSLTPIIASAPFLGERTRIWLYLAPVLFPAVMRIAGALGFHFGS